MQLRVYSEVTLYTNDRYLTDRNNRFRDLGWPRLASRLASKTEHETRFDHLPTYLCRLAWKYQKNIYLHLPHLPISCLKPTCSIEFSAMYVRAVLPDPLNKFCSHSMRWTSARCILSKWCCILFGQISEWNQIKNRQFSLKVAQNDFARKMKAYQTFTKNALRLWTIWAK